MRHIIYILFAVVLVTGCATSNIESRKKERLSAFNTLPPEQQQLVNAGQIRIGMTEDAVYIAIGRPDQIVQSQTGAGLQTTWIYMGEFVQEVQVIHRRYLAREYYPQSYVGMEVNFTDGKVATWRTMPRPGN